MRQLATAGAFHTHHMSPAVDRLSLPGSIRSMPADGVPQPPRYSLSTYSCEHTEQNWPPRLRIAQLFAGRCMPLVW